MTRHDGRRPRALRPIRMVRGYTKHPAGSVLIQAGDTHLLCTASWQDGVPRWRAGSGCGWVTAEYDMLPGSTDTRRTRNRLRIDGRTQEIQRLIGRVLRSVVDLEALGENTVLVDCDVLQADGGTRTAGITGGFVALADCLRAAARAGLADPRCVRDHVAAVSAGIVRGEVLIDLDHAEDQAAEVDLNLAMTGRGGLIEIQGTAERAPFTRGQLDRMLGWGAAGIRKLIEAQKRALRGRGRRRG